LALNSSKPGYFTVTHLFGVETRDLNEPPVFPKTRI